MDDLRRRAQALEKKIKDINAEVVHKKDIEALEQAVKVRVRSKPQATVH